MSNNSFKVKHSVVLTPKNLSTLVNPESGELACDINDGNKIKRYNSDSGSWVEVGSGGGGINYIVNDDFESGTTGYATYADAAGLAPVDGTGGTANTTFTATAVSPLRGTKSGLITKNSGASRQGEGVSYNFTIDSADQAQILRISFDYSTSANYADGDIRIYVYDVTNSRLIEVIDRDLLASTQGKFVGTFQSSPDSLSYRLILHIADTDTTQSWTVGIDNVNVSPQTIVKGAIVTDWENFTPTGTWSGVTYSGYKRRVGNSLEVNYSLTVTNNTLISGTLDFTVPDNLSIDTALVLNSTTSYFGQGLTNIGVTNHIAARFVSATTVRTVALTAGSTYVGYANVTNTVPAAPANGDILQLRVMIPIQGWSSNVTLSEDAGNRDIAAKIGQTISQVVVDGLSNFKVGFTSGATILYDTVSMWNPSTLRYEIPETGIYDLWGSISYGTGVTDDTNGGVIFRVDGSTFSGGSSLVGLSSGNTNAITHSASTLLNKGQYVELYGYWTDTVSNASVTIVSGTFTIAKRSSPQTIAASEVVSVRATAISGSISSSSTVFPYSVKDIDTHNAYNNSNGKFVAPQSGYYHVSAGIRTATITLSSTGSVEIRIVKNSVSSVARSYTLGNGASTAFPAQVNSVVYLNKGESIEIFVDCSVTTTATSIGGFNFLTITKINGVN